MEYMASFILKIMLFILAFINIALLPFILAFLFWFVYYFIRGKRIKKGSYRYVGYGSFIRRLFWKFPRQMVYDIYEREPDAFRDYGFHLIVGKQGTGKTITLVYMLLRYQKMYPKLVVKTNMSYRYEHGSIENWKDLVNSSNGIYGEIDVLDEVQNWFSSSQSKDFPPQMLREITQQRKQRKMIIGTTQVFNRVSKPIRENTYKVYEPTTILGCLTIVRSYEPVLDSEGTVTAKKPKGTFFFVHTKKIREAFDTYRKIEKMQNKNDE